jgi:hypothetical protein
MGSHSFIYPECLSDDDGIDDGMMTRLKAIAFLSSIAHPSI